jgi:hypothetical protein
MAFKPSAILHDSAVRSGALSNVYLNLSGLWTYTTSWDTTWHRRVSRDFRSYFLLDQGARAWVNVGMVKHRQLTDGGPIRWYIV